MTPSIDEVSGKARYFKTSSIFLHGGIKDEMSHFCDTIYCVCHSFVTLHTEFVTKKTALFTKSNKKDISYH